MKHLKNYKLFESSVEEIKEYLFDIFLELEDKGYDVSIKETISSNPLSAPRFRPTPQIKTLQLHINSVNARKTFKLVVIFDLILTSDSYMNDNGWFLDHIAFRRTSPSGGRIGECFFSLNKSDIENLKNPENLKKEINPINYAVLTFRPT